MSEVFRKAYEYVKNELLSNPSRKPLLMLEFPEFREGDYVINLYVDSNPPLLGRRFEEKPLQLSPENVRHIIRIGSLHGCTVHRVGEEFYYLRNGEIIAVIGTDHYAASEPRLFEEISREIYGIGSRMIEVDKPVGWLKALRILFSH
ncbi:MAG: hypothetical protein QXF28_02860 [Nitrososphaerota archaeon]